MSKPVVQRPKADEDIDDILAFLMREAPGSASDFLDAIEHAYELLSRHPGVGSTRHAVYCPELPVPLRFFPITGFPRLLIYYIDKPAAVEIIRVWDAARGLDALTENMEPGGDAV